MNLGIPKILPHLCREYQHLLLGPPMYAGQRCQGHGLDRAGKVVEVPLANSLVLGVLGPGIRRPLVAGEGYVLEPDLCEDVFQGRDLDKRPAKGLYGVAD